MPTPQKLCLVEATFTIKRYGLVVITTEWQAGQVVSRGDWIELRSSTGKCLQAQVKSLESVRRLTERGPDGTFGLCLIGITRGAVRAGDEIWIVDAPELERRFS